MADTKRVNAHLTPETLAACNARGPLSQALNRTADRYAELCARAGVEAKFTPAELDAIRDALSSWHAEPAALIARGPALEVGDALPDGLADKWGVSAADLMAKLFGLSYWEEVALVDSVERWWQAVNADALEPRP